MILTLLRLAHPILKMMCHVHDDTKKLQSKYKRTIYFGQSNTEESTERITKRCKVSRLLGIPTSKQLALEKLLRLKNGQKIQKRIRFIKRPIGVDNFSMVHEPQQRRCSQGQNVYSWSYYLRKSVKYNASRVAPAFIP